MEKIIKISLNPLTPNLEVVENFVMMTHVPYTNNDVVIKIDSNIQEYIENTNQENAQIRQVMVTTETEYSRTLNFDFNENNTHKIKIDDRNFEIKLIEIGDEELAEIQGQKFKYFKFSVVEK